MFWNRSNDFLKTVLILTCLWGCTALPGVLQAQEKKDAAAAKAEAEAAHLENFITQLRRNGFADLGIYYLEKLNAEGKLPATLKADYDFHSAVLMEASVSLERTNDKRLEAYDKVIALLEKYVKENPDGKYYALTVGFLPNIRLNKSLVYQTLATLNDPSEIDDSKMTPEEKKDLEKRKKEFEENRKKNLELARGELAKNIEFLTEYEKKFLEVAKKLDPKDEKQNAQRDEMLNELHNIRMARANSYYEASKTYPDGAKEKMDFLEKARQQYKFFWDKYASEGYLVAYRGRVNEAKMLIEMKKYTGKGEAIEILGDLYSGTKDLVSRDGERPIFIEVCTCYFQIFSDKEAKLKPNEDQQQILNEAMEAFNPAKNNSILRTYGMEKTPTGIQMRLAYIQFMEHALDTYHPKNEQKLRADIKNDVADLYRLRNHPYVTVVRELHTRLFPEEHIGDEPTNYTFRNYKKELAEKRAKNLTLPADRRENLYMDLRKFALKEFSNFFKARTELQTAASSIRKEELQEIVSENPEKISEVFALLESMKHDILRAKQIDILIFDRFYRAQILYVLGQQYEAIALLDFISKRYASTSLASTALFYELAYLNALIVNEHRALKKQIQSGTVTLKQAEIFEMFRGQLQLLESCIEMKAAMLAEPEKYALNEVDANGNPVPKPITKDPISFEWERLCKLCLMIGAVDMALEYIEKIPADKGRAALELAIGFNLWNMYIEFRRADDENKPFTLDQANEYQKLALELLESGAQKLKSQVKTSDDVTDTVLAAAMTLCESYSRRGDNKTAIEWLRDEKIGPYKLLCDEHPAVTDARKDRILNIALVAFVSENDMDSAFDAMNRLEKLADMEGDGDMDEKLTRKYMSLGIQLRDNLQSMVASGNEETLKQVKTVQQGFEEFLKRIQARENGNSYASLNWIAQTFISLAEGSQESGANAAVNEESRKYYETAITTYETMLGHLKDDPNFVTNADEEKITNLTLGLQRKIAETHESLGNFEEADKYYRIVLTAKPGLMVLQYKMMNMYVKWSRTITDDMKKKGNLLVQARAGIRSDDKKTSICRGWSGVNRGLSNFILPYSEEDMRARRKAGQETVSKDEYVQKRWLYYYSTLREAEVIYLFGMVKGGYQDASGKQAIDTVFNTIRARYDASTGSQDDFGGSVQKLDAEGNPTDEYFMKDDLVYAPLIPQFESLLKKVQEARGENPTGFANWTREVVEETPIDEDAFTAAQIEDNEQLVDIENKRLASEEDYARKMMTPKKKPTPAYITYSIYGGAGFAILVLVLCMMRGGKNSKAAKRRKEMLAKTAVPTDASGFSAKSEPTGPVSLGIGDEVVDSSAAANMFASMGLGDAPVIIEEEKKEEAPVFDLNFSGAPAAAAPAEKAPAPEKHPVKKVVKKPAPAEKAPEAAPAADASKPAVKKVVKKVVKRLEGAAPAKTEDAEKPQVKKVVKLVKKPTEEN